MKLEDFKVYHLSVDLGEKIYPLVMGWNYFDKDTIGKQLFRSADSIAANLSEGMGRYHYKERKNFSYYSRGSLFETKTWLTKAYRRKLLKEETFLDRTKDIESIGIKLNNYIKTLKPQ
ncbi:MAG: four helix bundle protein [Chlorobi bacterium]|nr:four helix bundle protein [Chlorobiota bacterium]